MKKIISILLVVLMILTMTPLTVFAENTVAEEPYLIALNANGGSGISDYLSVYPDEEGNYCIDFSEINPVREGYTLIGWKFCVNEIGYGDYIAGVFSTNDKIGIFPPSADVAEIYLTAIWQDNSKSVPKITAKAAEVKPGGEVTVEFYIENNDGFVINDDYCVYEPLYSEDVLGYGPGRDYSKSLTGDGKIYEMVFYAEETAANGTYNGLVYFPDVTNSAGEEYMFIEIPVSITVRDMCTVYLDTNGGQPHDPINLPKNEYGYAEIRLDDITVYREGYSLIGWLLEEKRYWQQEEWTYYRIPLENYDGTVDIGDNNTLVAVWQDNSKPKPMLTISPISAKPGETAIIEINISNNDGIVFESASVWSWLLPEGYGESINIVGHLKNNYSYTLKGDGKILELECDIPEDAVPGIYMGTVEFEDVINGAGERYLFKDVPIKVVVEGEVEKPDEYEKYTVTFDANGGEGLPDSIEVTADKEWYGKYCAEVSLGDYKPTREGYTLIGWQKTDTNGDGASSLWNEASSNIYEDTIFTAIWEKNDGSYPKLTAKVSPIEKVGDIVTIDFYIENNDGVIINDEYAFSGYNMTINYEDLVETNYSKELVGDGKIYSASFKLTAYNSSNNAEMFFSFADVVLGSGEKYMFTDISVPISVEKNTFRVVFDANGGKGVPEPYDVEIEENNSGYKYAYITLPPVPTREGFTFIGWQEVEDNGNYRFVKDGFYPDSKYRYIDGDTEFVAIWQDNSIAAPVIKAKPVTVKRGESVYVEFYIENNNNWMTIDEGSFLHFTFNTYYRDFKYRGYPDEDINYSGSLIGDGKIYDWSIEIAEDCFPGEYEYTVDFVDVTNGYGEPYMFLDVPVKITVDDEGAYVVKYEANGGTKEPYKQLKIEGEALTLSEEKPTREGYTFIGWATSSSAKKAEYQPGDSFDVDANTTLYAVWEVESEFECGDINLDGKVDVKDTYTARLIAAKLIKPTEQQLAIGDVDLDGKITAIDANLIRKYVIKSIEKLPIR